MELIPWQNIWLALDLLGRGWDDQRSFILASDMPGEPGASDNGEEDDIRN